MKKLRYISVILLSLFSIPAMAQEGHFGIKRLGQHEVLKKPEDTSKIETKVDEKIGMPENAGDFSELRSQGVVLIEQVIDPLRVRLQDGRIVQLAGIEIPDNHTANPGAISNKAYDLLKTMLEKKQATLYQTKDEGDGRRNRMGHYLGHLETHEGRFWVQGALLVNGLARIQPGPVNTEMAQFMMIYETEAMEKKRGLWASDDFGVLTPETAETAMNDWAIVEGKITKTGMSNNIVFLNFGDDWRRDFTIGVEGDARRQMGRKNIDLQSLGGKRVRVHGWVENYNGPYIKLSNAVWLEILPDKPASATLSEDN